MHIDYDLTEAEIEGLYQCAHCLVYPSRAEGFGLPIAEAMARRIPVITTAYGGQMDFCSEATAWLVDYRLEPSRSHLAVPGAQWAEPDVGQLRAHMRAIASSDERAAVERKVGAAWETIDRFRWSATAARCVELVAPRVRRRAVHDGLRLGMVTSWNSRCGIAEYSRYLLDALVRVAPGVQPVVLSSAAEGVWRAPLPSHHCWDPPPLGDLRSVVSYVEALELDIVHFQHNFGFFTMDDLGHAVEQLAPHRKVLITLHRTEDLLRDGAVVSLASIAPALRRAHALLVHSPDDVDRLRDFGLSDNVHQLPHGSVLAPPTDRTLRQAWGVRFDPLIGTFGFLLPHKGLLELLDAVAVLRTRYPSIGLIAQCALHREGISHQFAAAVHAHINVLGLRDRVLLSTEFLAPEEATLLLQLADLIVLPYKDTAESSSAAVRFALADGLPVLTTGVTLVGDVAAAASPLAACDGAAIAAAIEAVLADRALAARLITQAERHTRVTSWDRVAEQYGELLDQL